MDYDRGSTLAIVPALNEEITIGSIVLQLKEHVSTVIVVDDGSTDRTSDVARMAGAEVIRLEKNQGKAAAVQMGLEALKGREMEVVVLVDGDGQHIISEVPRVIAPIFRGEADLVIGSRLIDNCRDVPTYRRLGQKILNRFTNIGIGERLTDTQSGFRAMNMNGVRNMDLNCTGYSLESGMIIHFASRGLIIKEVSVGVRYDVPHKHKKNPVTMGFGLIVRLMTMMSFRSPLLFIGIPGLVLGAAGLSLGLTALGEAYVLSEPWFLRGAFASVLMVLGTILMVSSLTLNTIGHIVNQRHVKEGGKGLID